MRLQEPGKMSVNSESIEAFYDEEDDSGMNIKPAKAHKNVVVTDENLKLLAVNWQNII